IDCTGERAESFELLHPTCYVTDDSILTLAVMDWLLHTGDLRVVLRHYFRCSERPEVFGKLFRDWAASDSDAPCGSFGNGAAMRVAPVAFAAEHRREILQLARESAAVTHSTADAIAGAEAIALGVFLARRGYTKQDIQREIGQQFGYNLQRPLDEI